VEEAAASLARLFNLLPNEAPELLAARIGYVVIRDPLLPVSIRGMSADRTIWIRPDSYAPREHFACAHEVGELVLPFDLASGAVRELACQRFAAALLLPEPEFADSLFRCRLDVLELRRVWQLASHQAILHRISDLTPSAACGTWLAGIPERRWALDGRNASPSSAEVDAVRGALSEGRAVTTRGRRRAYAWRIAESRVLSVAVPR
jgi:hypothetical protein